MFDHVLVPYDGGPELRAAFAPAADLAWRCNAKLVVVSTTSATDAESRTLVKSLAISQSGADVDFWVDLERSIGDALVAAAAHRPNSVMCAASRYKQTGLVRRRNVIPIPRQVFTESIVPIMAIGPETVVSAGLPMTEVVMLHDGSDRSADTLATVAEWASGLRLAVRLVSLLSPNALDDERNWLIERMDTVLAEIGPLVPSASIEIVASRDAVETMVAFLTEHRDAFFVVSPDAKGSEIAAPGSFAAELLRRTPQALFFPRREHVVAPPPLPVEELPRVEPPPPPVEEVIVPERPPVDSAPVPPAPPAAPEDGPGEVASDAEPGADATPPIDPSEFWDLPFPKD